MHSNARATEHHQLHAEGRASLESYSGEDDASTSVAIKFWWIGVVDVTYLLRAALVASCFRGALPPVDLRAVCLVRAMMSG